MFTMRWESEIGGRWATEFIRNTVKWMNWVHGEVNYYLTQFFTEYGYFNAHLALAHLVAEDKLLVMLIPGFRTGRRLPYVFVCERWNEDREELTPDNIVETILPGRDY